VMYVFSLTLIKRATAAFGNGKRGGCVFGF
jgi:hypothetical protein